MVRTLGYKYLEVVYGFLYDKSPAKSAETQWIVFIHFANDVYNGGSETARSRRSWIQIIIHWNGILAVNGDCMQFLYDFEAPNDCEYVSKVSSNVSVNGASTIFHIASWKIP